MESEVVRGVSLEAFFLVMGSYVRSGEGSAEDRRTAGEGYLSGCALPQQSELCGEQQRGALNLSFPWGLRATQKLLREIGEFVREELLR